MLNSFFNIEDELAHKVNATAEEAETLLERINADIADGKLIAEDVSGFVDYCNRVINNPDVKHPEFPPYPN